MPTSQSKAYKLKTGSFLPQYLILPNIYSSHPSGITSNGSSNLVMLGRYLQNGSCLQKICVTYVLWSIDCVHVWAAHVQIITTVMRLSSNAQGEWQGIHSIYHDLLHYNEPLLQCLKLTVFE